MLSHHEDRHLRAIEQWFEADDPALARMFRTHESPTKPYQRKAARIAVDLTGAITFTIGALATTVTLVILGTLLIGAGVWLHLSAHRPPG